MNVYRRASWQSPAELTLSRGDEVEFTGKKETVGNITWAQVKVGDKTGWVFANYLKTDKEQTVPIESLPPYKQPRKKGDALPVKHQPQSTIGPDGKNGCVLACITMMFNYYGYNYTGDDIYRFNNNKYYADYTVILNSHGAPKDLTFVSSGIESENKVYNKCLEELKKGNPIMVEIDYDDTGWGKHSVVVYGYTGDWNKTESFDPTDFLVMDPYRETEMYPYVYRLNTLQDSLNMFKGKNPTVHMWRLVVKK